MPDREFRILVVADDPLLCSTMQEVLAPARCTLVCASADSWRGALQEAEEDRFHLIILEIAGNTSGAGEMVARVERSLLSRHVPIVLISDIPELEFEIVNIFDFLLKPVDANRILEDIEAIRSGRRRNRLTKAEPLGEEAYRLFHEYLLTRTGLHFDRRNLRILERGISSRMSALKIATGTEYFEYLTRCAESRQELQKLLVYLTIGETYFFRYHAHFHALKSLIREAAARDPRRPLRLWSAGCASGEEPYSLAMTVMEALPDWKNRDIRIFATDINNRVLRTAREGVYGQWAMRVMEKPYLDRHFRKMGKSYVINDDVKSLVEFSHLNLQTDDYPQGLDAILCRNVMIYFSLPTMRRVVERFAASLNPDGHLFLGHAETLTSLSSQYERITEHGGFFYRKRDAREQRTPAPRREPRPLPKREPQAAAPPPRPLPQPRRAASPAPPSSAPAPEALYATAQGLYDSERFAEADALLQRLLEAVPNHCGALVMQGFIRANAGSFDVALALAGRALAEDDLLPDAYFLRGLVLEMTEREREAAEEYRKAILLDMDFAMAHYNLGRLNLRLGKDREGHRQLRNCLKILEKEKEEAVIRFSGGLSREVFLLQLRKELPQVA
ncbi:MAG TPA: CheR family methyltransferase [Verrucomicrobiae bacterium]|nr:CheR family methyltransferase [Verrucomicrobiae bacterium]